ncbi:hypothetical protein [Haloprofundus halophilus]|uniref:hypothetical protein n=1 Tax=Haloprofundus halophilus TaxID=2283527 RepID=UPI002FCDC965
MALTVCLLVSLYAGFVVASPPQTGTEGNGLTENETATLWSRDPDACTSNTEYYEQFDENRSLLGEVGDCTDLAFKRPPETAATWTTNDFEDYTAGNASTSVYPSHADLEDSTVVRDAHATIFAVQPSTRTHVEPSETPLYVAREGRLRGVVDYRIVTPPSAANQSPQWSVFSHEIESVRLLQDGTELDTVNGTHKPAFDYELRGTGQTTLTLEATITVEFERPIGNQSTRDTERVTRSVVVSDSVDVTIYDPEASLYTAAYPNGDAGVAVFIDQPWQGYSLGGENQVRGVWRFYTARDTRWDTVVRSTANGEASVPSDSLPVYVHAYPSVLGPRAYPVQTGPQILRVWGYERDSPNQTIGENVHVGVVNESFTQSSGIAVRTNSVSRRNLSVRGIVRGVNATVETPRKESERDLRGSDLSLEVVDSNASQTTLRAELRDNETGEPIALRRDSHSLPDTETRYGYISVAGERVQTNESGVAVVIVDGHGMFTATYHPGSWLSHNPAYTDAESTVRHHPLWSISGVFGLFVEILWWFIPFLVALIAGLKLGSFLQFETFEP